ncbi:hypothetical protein DFJ77DRAFT_464408 [Powellomyces hirtus]|nr:hypothetical protein DFJ77DRAFT_464408 [Powellomyces hirtus]
MVNHLDVFLFLAAVWFSPGVYAVASDWSPPQFTLPAGQAFDKLTGYKVVDPRVSTNQWTWSASPGTWYKLTSQGLYWTGTAEADTICNYGSASYTDASASKTHCANSGAGIFSTSLGIACSGTGTITPFNFWNSDGLTACPSHWANNWAVYTTYIKSISATSMSWTFTDPGGYPKNDFITTCSGRTTVRTGVVMRLFEGVPLTSTVSTETLAPVTSVVTSRTTTTATISVTATLPPVTRSVTLPAVTSTLPAVTSTATVSLPAVTSTLPALTYTATATLAPVTTTLAAVITQTLPPVTETKTAMIVSTVQFSNLRNVLFTNLTTRPLGLLVNTDKVHVRLRNGRRMGQGD